MVMKHKHTKSVLILALLISILSCYCALRGFADQSLYGSTISTGVFKMEFMPGTISQDSIAIAMAPITVLLLVLYSRKKDMRVFISIIGMVGFYFYAYATYVISALYTSLYPVYMLILTLSIFALVLGISGFDQEDVQGLFLPRWLQWAGIGFLALIVLIFVPMWLSHIIPYSKSHFVPPFYAIYILDLCIVMPFFVSVIYMVIRKNKTAYVYLGIALLKTWTLIVSVMIGELTAETVDKTMAAVYGVIIIISSLLYILYCAKLKSGKPAAV